MLNEKGSWKDFLNPIVGREKEHISGFFCILLLHIRYYNEPVFCYYILDQSISASNEKQIFSLRMKELLHPFHLVKNHRLYRYGILVEWNLIPSFAPVDDCAWIILIMLDWSLFYGSVRCEQWMQIFVLRRATVNEHFNYFFLLSKLHKIVNERYQVRIISIYRTRENF